MFDQYLRIPKEKIMEPLARGPLGSISPNAISISACLVSVGSGVAAWQGQNGLSLGLWYLNRFLDGLDGTVARVNQKQSDYGVSLLMFLGELNPFCKIRAITYIFHDQDIVFFVHPDKFR